MEISVRWVSLTALSGRISLKGWKSPRTDMWFIYSGACVTNPAHLSHDGNDRRNDVRETDFSVFRMCRCQVQRGARVYKTQMRGPVWETLPGGHHEASPPCLRHFLHCGTGLRIFSRCGRRLFFSGDVHGNQGHHRLRRQHLLLPLHHRLRPIPQGFSPNLVLFCSARVSDSFFFVPRLCIGSRAPSNVILTPMENRQLRISSLLWVASC